MAVFIRFDALNGNDEIDNTQVVVNMDLVQKFAVSSRAGFFILRLTVQGQDTPTLVILGPVAIKQAGIDKRLEELEAQLTKGRSVIRRPFFSKNAD